METQLRTSLPILHDSIVLWEWITVILPATTCFTFKNLTCILLKLLSLTIIQTEVINEWEWINEWGGGNECNECNECNEGTGQRAQTYVWSKRGVSEWNVSETKSGTAATGWNGVKWNQINSIKFNLMSLIDWFHGIITVIRCWFILGW